MAETSAGVRWTVADLDSFPDDPWKRYEIIDGELFVSRAPGDDHQIATTRSASALDVWSQETDAGFVMMGPGLIFDDSDSVIPDVVWVSRERMAVIEGEDKHLHGAPELVVEVLSPGATNERRDRETKLKLYSSQGVREYWIIDCVAQTVAVYRRYEAQLRLEATLGRDDTLTSPMLPGFALPVARLFPRA
jgi:Uma2 family endonuclease